MAFAWSWNFLTIIGLICIAISGIVWSGIKKVGKENMGKAIWGFGVLGLVLLAFGTSLIPVPGFISGATGGAQPLTISEQRRGIEPGADPYRLCPDDLDSELYVSYEDPYASTLTYLAVNWYVKDGGLFSNASSSAISPGYGTSSVTVNCGEVVDVTVPTSALTYSSVAIKNKEIRKPREYVDVQGAQLDAAQIRVLDITTDSYQYLFPNGTSGNSYNGTSFDYLNQTNVFGAIGGTDISVGSDGYLDYQIEIKTANSNKYLGEPNQKVWLSTDVGTDNEWQEPDVSFDGKQLTDRYGEIDSVSRTGSLVSAADYAFVLTDNGLDLGDTLKKIGFYIKARSGQDPDTSNDDLTVCILAEGQYLSSEEAKTFKTGIYTDASTQALTVYNSGENTHPCLIINIA